MLKLDTLQGTAPRTLATVTQLHQLLGGSVSEAAIRAQVWAAEERQLKEGRVIKANGLAPAIIKIGRKVLIDVDAYVGWLESHRLAPLADLESVRQKAA